MSHSLLMAAGCIALIPTASWAALPLARCDRVIPVSALRGGTTDVSLEGSDLEGTTRLVFSDDRITAMPIDGGKFRVSVPAEVPFAMVDIRAVGTWGISNPRTMIVSRAASVMEAEPNNLIEQAQAIGVGMPAEGLLAARADVDYFSVALDAGQKVVIDLQAERIDSAMDGVITLFAPDGKALELSNGYAGKDPRIDLTAPVAGSYRIRVHDLVYGGGPGYFYRLLVHQDPTIDIVFPPVATRGIEAEFELNGRNLPGSTSAENVLVHGQPLERVTMKFTPPAGPANEWLAIDSFMRPRSAQEEASRLPLAETLADRAGVLIGITDFPVVREVEPNDADPQAPLVAIPASIAGRLDHPNDKDLFRFHAVKDQLLEVAGVSERLGSPADLSILLRRITATDPTTGVITAEDVTEFDDDAESVGGLSYITSSHDPLARLVIPADGDYLLQVRDRFSESRGDGRFVYFVRVGPPLPDYQLLVAPTDPSGPSSLLVRSGGTTDAVVYALRRGGFVGEIAIQVEGLPTGVTASPVVLGPGVSQGLLVFQASADAADIESKITVKGSAKMAESDVVRIARAGTIFFPASGNAPRPARLARSIHLAVRPGAPYLLIAHSDFPKIGQGSMLDVGLQLERRTPDFSDKLAGVTVPYVPGTVENSAIEIPAGQNAGRISLYVKPETPPGRYSLAMKGTASIPFTKSPADPNAKKEPVEVALPSPPIEIVVVARPAEIVPATAEPTAKPNQQISLAVKINRQNGYVGPMELSLRLPAGLGGITAPLISLPADVSETIVPIQLASDVPVGDKGGITVRGTAKVGDDIIPVDARIVLKVMP
ncbi:PPC domain-containing protein [bacterium]|nr:PPC domain-containing protein [bacterium]